nr:hypothetical protein [Candidatus Freyarchaeota archaeon]
MKDKVKQVWEELRNYVNKFNVVSKTELIAKINELLFSLFTDKEREQMESDFSMKPTLFFFESIVGETPHSIYSPHLSEKDSFQGETFYHSHTYPAKKENIQKAYERLEEIKLKATTNILKNKLEKAGYQLKTENKKIFAKKPGYTLKCTISTNPETIKSEIQKSPDEYKETVIIIPTGSSISPFKELYKESNKLLDNQTIIWVANIQSHTLSPFIGVYPGEKKDKELAKHFEKPELASRISSTWKAETNLKN